MLNLLEGGALRRRFPAQKKFHHQGTKTPSRFGFIFFVPSWLGGSIIF